MKIYNIGATKVQITPIVSPFPLCPLKNEQFSHNERKSYIPSHNADSPVQTVICKAQSVYSARHAVK